MKSLLLLLLALLPQGPSVTGIWSGPDLYVVLKQEGSSISGSGGPSKSQQIPFKNGTIDGDRITIKTGAFELELRVLENATRLQGELRAEGQVMPVDIHRFDPNAKAPAVPSVFDVVSIKPNVSGGRGSRMSMRGGEIVMTNASLKMIIEEAYRVKDFSLSGPDWLDTVRFDVTAKPPAGASREQLPVMLQAMLGDRFQLKVHRETKTMQAYALLLAKSGLKLQAVEPGPGHMDSRGSNLHATRTTMSGFAEWLSNRLDHPVVDQTGNADYFDINLEWTADDAPPPAAGAASDAERPVPQPGPSIYTALQEQLGLRLVSQKLPVEIVVIDSVRRAPTEN